MHIDFVLFSIYLRVKFPDAWLKCHSEHKKIHKVLTTGICGFSMKIMKGMEKYWDTVSFSVHLNRTEQNINEQNRTSH